MPGGRSSRARVARRVAWWALLWCVTVAHWWLAAQLPDSHYGEGWADEAPKPIDVAFVRELAVTAPPTFAAPPPPPSPVRAAAPAPEPAASAASGAAATPAPASAPAPEALQLAEAASSPARIASAVLPAPEAEPAQATASAASAASAVTPAASAPATPTSSAVAFDWPPSTRLSYVLTGDYRGPLYGTAQVEWLRDGSHYQVRLQVSVPPVVSRRMLSDGVIGPQGLSPRRYDEETEVTLRETRRLTVLFEPDRIQLANGKVNDPLPGVQDSASQFVQMTWLFLTRPELLQVGKSVEFPLALPRRVGQWTYDITEQVELNLPFGTVQAFHLYPRPANKRPNELIVETWVAPSLQYLPVKIVIRQDTESYIELNLKSAPLQAAAPAPAASGPGRIVR
ncbi:DUF3108 domain-containing protein [Ideonella sp. DXS29W]|uniref:DUF3108 domain-containing protein n=1 Tax=Ideonella lacteola TaxID=2984193 RepID=A0ABU9BSQ3_9BURK